MTGSRLPRAPEGSSGRRPGRVWAIAGIVSGVSAVMVLPIILGPLGIVLGVVGYAKGSRGPGTAAMVAGVLGLLLAAFLLSVFG